MSLIRRKKIGKFIIRGSRKSVKIIFNDFLFRRVYNSVKFIIRWSPHFGEVYNLSKPTIRHSLELNKVHRSVKSVSLKLISGIKNGRLQHGLLTFAPSGVFLLDDFAWRWSCSVFLGLTYILFNETLVFF